MVIARNHGLATKTTSKHLSLSMGWILLQLLVSVEGKRLGFACYLQCSQRLLLGDKWLCCFVQLCIVKSAHRNSLTVIQ